MSKKKLCFICPWMHNDGGLQRVVSNLANMMVKKDYEVTVCIISVSTETPYYPLDSRIHVVHMPEAAFNKKDIVNRVFRKILNYIELPIGTGLLKKIYYSPKRIQPLEQYLIKMKFDYVVASCGDLSMLLACINRKNIDSKLIGWQHNSFDAYFEKKGQYYYGRKSLAKKLYSNLDQMICLTEKDRRIYSNKLGVKSQCIYNPLTFETFEKANVRKNKSLLFVGRLEWEQKGLGLFIDILERFFADSRSNDWNALVIGDGTDRKLFEEALKKNKLDHRVIMTGKIRDVEREYVKGSILLNTSQWEGFGLVITEAMECGLPVVAFSTDGPCEIISEGIDGYLIPKYNIAMFAEKLLELAENLEKRKTMSQNAIQKAETFSKGNIMKQWETMFMKMNK